MHFYLLFINYIAHVYDICWVGQYCLETASNDSSHTNCSIVVSSTHVLPTLDIHSVSPLKKDMYLNVTDKSIRSLKETGSIEIIFNFGDAQ